MHEEREDDYYESDLITSFSEALIRKEAALFIGSGISSTGSDTSPWRSLLKPLMDDPLRIGGVEFCDLPLIAQYVSNELGENTFLRKISEHIECNTAPNEIHEIMHDMPLDVIWTTNYDRVIENAYNKYSPTKKIDHKYEPEAIHRNKLDHISLYKMHGYFDHPKTIIITKKHYDTYHIKNSLFINHLNYHLTKRVFLFIGFGFTDPNVNHILSRLKTMSEGATNKHFLILLSNSKKKEEINARRLWTKELKNYGIDTIVIGDSKELIRILKDIVNKVVLHNIALCGSSKDEKWDSLCRSIGKMLMEDEARAYNLYTCFAKGVGRSAIGGALEHFAETLPTDTKPYEKVRIWPVNRGLSGINDEQLNIFREGMISDAGACIFVGGEEGTRLEWNIAKEKGKFCIPLGFTGGTSSEVWTDVNKNINSYLRKYNLSDEQKKEIKELIIKLKRNDEIEIIINYIRRILALLNGTKIIDSAC